MQKIFDAVLIGSGPSAVSVLAALPPRLSVAIVTGEGAITDSQPSNIHSKIRVVARERKELPGIANPLYFEEKKGGGLFDTATIGGLANYWGQQVIECLEGDPWPREHFSSYTEYLQICSTVKALFTCSGTQDEPSSIPFASPYVAHTPHLLMGTKVSPESGLKAMREAFMTLSKNQDSTFYANPAIHLEPNGSHIRVYLADGKCISARRCFLAAGVVGSLRLIMASCQEVQSIRMADHAPYMCYFLDQSRLVKRMYSDTLDHFNYLSLQRIEAKQTKLFASLYRMSRAPIGMILAALGLPPYFSRTRPPQIIDRITPVQVWTQATYMSYQLNKEETNAHLLYSPVPKADTELQYFQNWLSNYGFILHRSQTTPGYGFHYHAGEVSMNGKLFHSPKGFIKERFEGKLLCVDSSILTKIGTRPHTLTSMASTYNLVRHEFQ